MIGYSILFFRGFLKFFSSLPPSSLLSVLNPQPQLSRHLTISHAVPVCASSLKNFFLLFFKLLNATPWPLYDSHRGESVRIKKKKSEKWNRLSSKVAVTNSQMEGKSFCDGFQCVAAWALSRQQQELRQLSLWPSVSHSPQHRQRTRWRWKGLAQREEGEDSLLGTPKTLCTDDNRVSQTKAQVRPFASSFFYLSIVVFFWVTAQTADYKQFSTFLENKWELQPCR